MTTKTTVSAELPEALRPIQRFNNIVGLMNPESRGLYVRYEDHVAQVEALSAAQAGVPAGYALVPLEFVRGFNTLAHNYSLHAVPPDYYHGTEGDAFRAAYRRCGQDLAKLRDLLAAAPQPSPSPAQPAPELQIAAALRIKGLTLVKTEAGYEVLGLGEVMAQPSTSPAPAQPGQDGERDMEDDQCRCEPCDYVRPADYDGDGSVSAMARRAARAAPQPANPWQRALEIRMAQGWKLKGDRVPVLYTDTINGDGVGRDDLWLCTTSALAAPQPATADAVDTQKGGA